MTSPVPLALQSLLRHRRSGRLLRNSPRWAWMSSMKLSLNVPSLKSGDIDSFPGAPSRPEANTFRDLVPTGPPRETDSVGNNVAANGTAGPMLDKTKGTHNRRSSRETTNHHFGRRYWYRCTAHRDTGVSDSHPGGLHGGRCCRARGAKCPGGHTASSVVLFQLDSGRGVHQGWRSRGP